MKSKKELAATAISYALRIRKKLGIPLDCPVSPLDVAESLGIEVRLVDFPSMEGMYVTGRQPTIFISTLRPQGRRNFTCAHEIGHDVFGHGEQYDEMTSEANKSRKDDPNEFLADCFASYLLMPKTTIDKSLSNRNYQYANLTEVEIYSLASWLGVGYTTLINHMCIGLKVITQSKATQLTRLKPKQIRANIFPKSSETNLHLVDEHWIDRTVDCEIGDYIVLPPSTAIEGQQVEVVDRSINRTVVEAKAAGIARASIESNNWAVFIRVSKTGYTGRGCFRFEEEIEE